MLFPQLIAIIGDVNRREFREVLETARETTETRAFRDLKSLSDWVGNSTFLPRIDLGILLHSYPGEHREQELLRLQGNYPITPFVSVLGSWCEGEMRTGKPLPVHSRFYWYEWASRGAKEFHNWTRGGFSSFHFPTTFGKEEEIHFLQTHRRTGFVEPPSSDTNSPLGVVVSLQSPNCPDREMNLLLAEILKNNGYSVQGWNSGELEEKSGSENPLCLLADIGAEFSPSLSEQLTRLRKFFPHATVLLFFNGPRIEEYDTFLRIAADHVFSKPFELGSVEQVLQLQAQSLKTT